MYKKDFIMRMIEMLAELIAGILGLLKEGKIEEASEKLDNAYTDLLKEDATFFKNIDIDKLTSTLLDEHNYTNDHLEILSELFYTEGKIHETQENFTQAHHFYKKALRLYEHVVNHSSTFSFTQQNKLNTLKKIVENTSN